MFLPKAMCDGTLGQKFNLIIYTAGWWVCLWARECRCSRACVRVRASVRVCVCVCDRSPIDFLSWSSKRFVFPHRRASMAAGGSGIGGDGDSGYAVGWLSSPLSRWSVVQSCVQRQTWFAEPNVIFVELAKADDAEEKGDLLDLMSNHLFLLHPPSFSFSSSSPFWFCCSSSSSSYSFLSSIYRISVFLPLYEITSQSRIVHQWSYWCGA